MPDLSQDNYDSVLRVTENLARLGKARMFVTFDSKNEPGFCAVYLIDSKRAYYLFGSGDPEHQGDAAGTLVHWNAFQLLKNSGISEVDLVGANSPNRGAFKVSFGGRLVPYFDLKLDRSSSL